jgi:hypothetical protein
MYTWTRVTQFKSVAAMMAGVPICTAIVDHMNKELGQQATLLKPVLGGHPARILFVIKADGLDEAMTRFDKANQDGRFRELVGKLAEFVDGSATVDQVWQDVA